MVAHFPSRLTEQLRGISLAADVWSAPFRGGNWVTKLEVTVRTTRGEKMNRLWKRVLMPAMLGVVVVCAATAQEAAKPPYLDPSLAPEQRAADLVHRMTLQEKASQLVNQARAIPRLGVPAYDWWSEALHGVAVNGTTEFPEPIGLAATFDTSAIGEMAT